MEEDIVRGWCRFKKTYNPTAKHVNLLGSGTILMQSIKAAELQAPVPVEHSSQASSSQESTPAPATLSDVAGTGDLQAEVLVLDSGRGGYTAAFRAADLGLKPVLIERNPTHGGVCLNVGCIPSKALLHFAKVITEYEEMGEHGFQFVKPVIDLDKLRSWNDSIVGKLTVGFEGLAKAIKVTVISGVGEFAGPNLMSVKYGNEETRISFDRCVVAAGSEPVSLPFIPHYDARVLDSIDALELDGVPDRLLVLGGGIIGLEMACVYEALGSKITIVEMIDQIIPGADKDLVKPLHTRIKSRCENIYLSTKVTSVSADEKGLTVTFEGPDGTFMDMSDKVLVGVG